MSHQVYAQTLGNLADVYIKEGNEEKAYELWQRAFVLEDGSEKDIILLNMLQYDLKRQRHLEDACERIYRIFAIKDSMANALKDRSVQDLQQQYDQEVIQHAFDKKIMGWAITVLTLTVFILLTTAYFLFRRHQARMLLAQQQTLISSYTYEIKMLEESGIALNEQIDNLKKEKKELLENGSPTLNRGMILYNQIEKNGKIVNWNRKDYTCFVEYYKAINMAIYQSIEKRYRRLTPQNTFFLILQEMGKDDRQISQIMGISPEAVRSTRFRIRKNNKKKPSKRNLTL